MYNKIIKGLINVSLTRVGIKEKYQMSVFLCGLLIVKNWIVLLCSDLSRLLIGKTLETFPSGRRVGTSRRFDLISAEIKENSAIVIKMSRNVKLLFCLDIISSLLWLTDSWKFIFSSASWQLIPLWTDSSLHALKLQQTLCCWLFLFVWFTLS